MDMRIAPIAAALAVLLTVGLAAGPVAAAGQASQADTEDVVEMYNQNVDQAPDVIRDRFADERVVLTVERAGEEDDVYTAVTDDDARIESLEEGAHDPTMRVTTDEETMRDIAQSEDTTGTAVDAYRSERVDVEGVGVTNTVTVEATKIGYAVASKLGLL